MEEENKQRMERREKAAKLSKRWELLRVCKDMMKEEGINWKKSKERKERDMQERMEQQEQERRSRKLEEEGMKRQGDP